MNLAAIRDKGLALGLIRPDQTLSDEDVMQLVLEPGFSTAGALTQQAGRGVGMDVVAIEIKKLGGALHMESKPGQGTRFTIRLPFTLAVSHALVVRTGDEYYALPLPTMEGVVRLPRDEVAAHLRSDSATFSHGGQKYRLQPLALYVGMEASPLPETDVAIPVVLVRAGEHSTGLVADELIGSREIVVKPVGPQISGIRGISGATILGDGRIVIILDIGALVRARVARARRAAPSARARRPAHLRAGGGRFDHGAARDAAAAGAQRHAGDDGARRHGRGGAAGRERAGHHPARHRDAAHGRLRSRRARARRSAPARRADHHDHLARRREASRARHRARRR